MIKTLLKYSLFFFISVNFLSCSEVNQDSVQERIELDRDEVDEIVANFPIHDGSLNIVFDDSSYAEVSSSGTGTLGRCTVETNTIKIDERFWVEATRFMKETLLYHEMAHCLLGIGHHSKTLMDSFIGFGAQSYEKHGLGELNGLPCSSGCDLSRVQNNRASFNSSL